MITKNKAALCGLSVFVFGLISCTEDMAKQTENRTAWSLREPVIRQNTGVEIKYTDVNQTPGVTYSVDDQIAFVDDVSEVELAVNTVCSRNEERHTYARRTQMRKEMKLLEFLPHEVLYSPDALHLNGVSCSLELTAYHKDGSTHYFPALHLKMNDLSQNEVSLISGMKRIEPINNHLPRIQIAKFGDVYLSRLSPGEEYYLQCETLSAVSGNRDIRTLAEMEVQEDLSQPRPSEVCRLFRLYEDSAVLAVSPFFVLDFLNMAEMIEDHFTPIISNGAFHMVSSLNGIITLSRQIVRNKFSEPLYLRIPKAHPAHLSIRMHQSVETTFNDSIFTSVHGSSNVRPDPNYWFVRLDPGQELTIGFEIRPYIECRYFIHEIHTTLDEPVMVQAMDKGFGKDMTSWTASPTRFSPVRSNIEKLKFPPEGTVYRHQSGLCRLVR